MNSEAVSPAEIEAHLERVLASATFRGGERSRRLLRYIVEQTLQGHADRLKDYTLGADALGRGEGFDPRTDPIARVEMSRLRSRLDVYYAVEGASDDVRIVVPKGGYVPIFEARHVEHAPVASGAPGEAGGTRAAALSPPWSRASTVLAALLAAVIATGTTWWLTTRVDAPAGASEIHLELTTPSTTDPGSFAIAPDGQTLAFLSSGGDVSRLWLRRLQEADARPLAGTEYASLPFWSPDGRAIGFFADGQIKAIDLQTRLVRVLATAPVAAGAAWNQDGVILHPLVPDSPLFQTKASDGSRAPATQLAPGQTGHRGPTFLPDGRRFLFYAAGSVQGRGIFVGDLGSPGSRRLLDADAPAVFAPPNQLLYVQHGTLFARAFDPLTATVTGEPVTISDDVSTDSSAGLAAVSASSGRVVYRQGPVGELRQMIWVDRAGREVSRIGAPEARGPYYGALSPDGRRLAVQKAVDGNTDIWLVDLERGRPVRFTTNPRADIAPTWSPQGDRIAYASQVDGVFELFEQHLNRGQPRLLLRRGEPKQITDWSRDGRYLLYRTVSTTPRADNDIWAVAVDGERAPSAVVRTRFEERDAQFSPAGTWIAYQSNDSGRHEVYIQPFNQAGERVRISENGGVQPRWRADGRELFYLSPDGQLTAVPIEWSADHRLPRPGGAVALFRARLGSIQGTALHSYVVAPDGQRVLLDTLIEQHPSPIQVIVRFPGGAM